MIELSAAAITRIIRDLLDETIGEVRGRRLHDEPGFDERDPGAFSLAEDGAGLDSLEMLTAAGAVNEFFRIHETGIEDLLLRRRRLSEWAEIVAEALAEGVSGLTFRTSGTTGVKKRVGHPWPDLEQEIDFLAGVFRTRSRVISTVPAHHIYGFLFTVMLPGRLEAPVEPVRWDALGSLGRRVAPGDLIVAHPTLWRYLSRTVSSWPKNVWGTSSTAPLPPDVHRAVRAAGLERLVEIYGSTETAGVGLRDDPEDPLELFPFFSRHESGLLRRLPGGGERADELRDMLEWVDDRHFVPRGRVDRVVQVGGENVDLAHVEDVLSSMPGVDRAYARPTEVDGEPRVKAFVVPVAGEQVAATPDAVAGFARNRLRSVERPVSITIGEAAPTNELGKIVDWEPA
jgi:4-coumarate--CoA ligase (photoactive yellow protein activation family)